MGGRRAPKPGRDPTPPPPEAEALREAVAGLTYPSESDAPFEVCVGKGPGSAEQFVTGMAGAAETEAVPVDQFFADLEGTDQAARYLQLRKVLEENLSDLKVLRVGRVKVDVYVVGRTRGGPWVGLHTTSIET